MLVYSNIDANDKNIFVEASIHNKSTQSASYISFMVATV